MRNIKTIGEVILLLRTQNNISRSALSQGVCSGKTLERIENGTQTSHMWLLEALLGRLGRTTTSMEHYLSKKDYVLQELRGQIKESYHSGNTTMIPELLQKYSESYKINKELHRQFIFKMRALLCKEGEDQAQLIEKALYCTLPQFDMNKLQSQYLSEEEINLIVLLSDVYEKIGENERAYILRNNCFSYLQQERISEEMRLRYLPPLALSVVEQAKAMSDKKNWKEVTEQTISLLRKNRVLHRLPEMMLLRSELMQMEAESEEERHLAEKELQNASLLKEIQTEYGEMRRLSPSQNMGFMEQSAYHFIGNDIQKRRTALHVTQEELTRNETLCTIRQLSNIETGKSKPEEYLYYELMTGLGVDESFFESYVDISNFTLNEKRFQINRYMAQQKYAEAEILLHELKKEFTESKADKQYQLFVETMLDVVLRQLSPSVALEYLEQALSYSMPNYEYQDLVSWSLSRNEVKILNSIAIIYAENGDLCRCISILNKLKIHYNSRFIITSHLKLYEMILLNLAKYLGLQGEYQKAIEVIDEGIGICMQTGNINALPVFIYGKVWNIEKIQDNADNICKHYLKQAYLLSIVTEDTIQQRFMVSFYQEKYHETL